MQTPGRPPQAGSCEPRGRNTGRKAGKEATLFIASKQTNRFAHKKPKKKRKNMFLPIPGLAGRAILVGRGDKG